MSQRQTRHLRTLLLATSQDLDSAEIAHSKPTYPQSRYDSAKAATKSKMHRAISECAIRSMLSVPPNRQDIILGSF